MTVFHPKEFERDALLPEEDQQSDYVRPTDFCFKCGGVLGDEHLVYECQASDDNSFERAVKDSSFRFHGVQIWLHADCAHDLALALLDDYLKVKGMRDRKEARARFGLPPDDEEP